jgi:iron(III) transport system substrate-binding protein
MAVRKIWCAVSATLLLTGCAAGASDGQTAGGRSCTDETGTTDEVLRDGAEQEGQVLWYTAIPAENAEAVGAAFTEKYEGVTVEVVRAPSYELWERFRTEASAGAGSADVFSPSDYGVIAEAKELDYLAEYLPPGIQEVVDDQFVDDEGYFWSNRVTTAGLVYNTDRVPADRAPKEWADLLDPFWRGKLGIGDPRESSAIYGAYWEMANDPDIGADYFQRLAENEPILYAQGGQQLNAVTTGEIAATIVVDYRGWQLIGDGAPAKVIYPESGVGYTLDYNTVVADAPQPCAARLFMNFLGNQEGGDVLAESLGTYLTRTDVEPYPREVDRPTIEEINLLELDEIRMADDFESFNAKFTEWLGI